MVAPTTPTRDTSPVFGPEEDTSFLDKVAIRQEQLMRLYPHRPDLWATGYRVFESPNILPIERWRKRWLRRRTNEAA
jgi:hypothetical protein